MRTENNYTFKVSQLNDKNLIFQYILYNFNILYVLNHFQSL